MDVIEAIKGLMLDGLDANCIESVWDEEFMCSPEILDEYLEQIDISQYIAVVDDIITAIDNWQDDQDVEHRTWRELNNENIDHKALLTVLWCFMVKGQSNIVDGNSRYLSLRSATLYLKLLSIPGSRVYHAFHPYLCMKTMSVLNYGLLIAPKQNKKYKKLFDCNDLHLTAQETQTLVRELNETMDALKIFVTKFSLQSDDNLVEEIVERLAETTRLEIHSSDFITHYNYNRTNSNAALSSFCRNAYECLRLLCMPEHGDVEDTVILVLKHLLPGVLFANRDLSLREQCIIRDHTLHFIKYLVAILGVNSLRGVTLFIHNIFKKIGDRAESRQKGKESIVKIMKILPNKKYSELVRWLFDCVHCDRASYRLFALEIVAQLLYEERDIPFSVGIPVEADNSSNDIDSNSNTDNTTELSVENQEEPIENNANSSNETDIMLHKYMLAIIFARCRDSSGNVRAKALDLLVQCMRSENMVVQSLMNEIFVLNHQNESSDKGFLNYKQLTEAIRKKTNMDPLPGAGVILSELESMSGDNKVHVRKAALQALESIVKLNRSWLTTKILKIMGSRCRDPAVSIRKEIVMIISELLQRYPDDRELAKMWTKCVVPLVLDQEGKLQECVLKVSVSLLVLVLEVLLSCSAYLPRQVQEEILIELKTDLRNFNVKRELVRLNVEIAMDLTYHVAESKKEAGKTAKSWTGGGRLSSIPSAKPLTVVAVGKLCLLNQLWAQETTKPLIKLLNTTQDLPTLINIIFVMRDLCVRYGTIMEPYLPSLWMCLKDAATDVRLTALTCLIELIQNNYIKFRGPMFFHILSMLCDTDENIVELTTYFLQDYLIPTFKNIMLEHMVNAIFHYNGYKVCCSKQSNHQNGAAEGKIRLDADGESVILDAIKILNSKNIQLRGIQQEPDDEPSEENVERMSNLIVKVANKAIMEAEKTFMIENIVPVAIHLKAVLQERYSSLIPHLMEYLRDMMKDYKNQVMGIFAEDKQTAEEILFEISELERTQRRLENVNPAEEENANRADDNIPQTISSLLQNSSPWIRQSIGPEIVRCYKIGGEEMMLRYARAKLRRVREKNRRISSCIRPTSLSLIGLSPDFLVEPKEEELSEKGGEECDRDSCDCGISVRRTEFGTEENCEASTSMVVREENCEASTSMVVREENCEASTSMVVREENCEASTSRKL
ncbi:hypothetical protein C0J52_01357 [Blattella germanica]|nr:hypothetical protein C0J52_01357 [Blattella germanica]